MAKSLLQYKNNKVWVHDSHLEIILFYCSKLPGYKKQEADWMKPLKNAIPFYLQGFAPGAIDLKLDESLTMPDRVDFFIQLLKDTKTTISNLGEFISADQLNEVEEMKGMDAIPWNKALETETITDILDQLIAFIRLEEIDATAPLKSKATKSKRSKATERVSTAVVQHLRLKEKLGTNALELKNGLLYDGMWDNNKTLTIQLSQINKAYKDLTFSFKEIEKSYYFSELKERLSAADFKQLMKASKVVSKPFGETILYKTRLKQSAYYLIKKSGPQSFLICLGYSETQPMRWKISLESIHVIN